MQEPACEQSWEHIAAGMYGTDAASHMANGILPPPEEYQEATVLVFDVVGYTKRCARMTPPEVAKWMTELHVTVS